MMDLRCGLQASYHWLSPLTAPREERSREIRRIAHSGENRDRPLVIALAAQQPTQPFCCRCKGGDVRWRSLVWVLCTAALGASTVACLSRGDFAQQCSVRLSQKSHKVVVLLRITLLSALSLPDRRERGSGWLAVPMAAGALLGCSKFS